MTGLAELAALASGIAREVAVELPFRGGDSAPTSKSSSTDLVTEWDVWAENHITARLLDARPDDAVLGEEGSGTVGSSGVRWIIDPIDGTTNFVYGHPGYAISIAAEIDGADAVGVVHDVLLDQHFVGMHGEGATCNGAPLTIPGGVDLAQALVATGFGYRAERRERQADVLRAVLPKVRDIRRMGGAAVDLCSVALGRVDAYFERGIQRWDIAAGAVIAREAGALVTDAEGGAAREQFVVAAPPGLHEVLLDMLVRAGAHLV